MHVQFAMRHVLLLWVNVNILQLQQCFQTVAEIKVTEITRQRQGDGVDGAGNGCDGLKKAYETVCLCCEVC